MRSVGMIFLITGDIQSGKTSLCLDVIEAAREKGVRLGGVISPADFLAGEKMAIDLQDVRSGDRVRLAELLGDKESQISTKRWAFVPEAVEWGNQILKDAIPCDLLVIDELGPLEFDRGEGWINGFESIASGEYKAALVVIRPSLLEKALDRWEVDRVINLDEPAQQFPTGKEICESLFPAR